MSEVYNLHEKGINAMEKSQKSSDKMVNNPVLERDDNASQMNKNLSQAIHNLNHNEILEIITDPKKNMARDKVHQLTEQLIQSTGRGIDLKSYDLSGMDLSGFNFRRANFNQCRLYGTNLSDANLSEASLICPGLERTNFKNANISKAYLHALGAQVCNFAQADLSHIVDMTGALFHGCNMNGANFEGAVLSGTAFYQCNLDETRFVNCNLQGSTFNESTLEKSVLMNSQVSQVTITKCYMRSADLSGANGDCFVLQRLTNADNIILRNANLPLLRIESVSGTNIQAENLYAPKADLHNVNVITSNFLASDFSFGRFIACCLSQCNFHSAKFESAYIQSTSAISSDFSNVLGENIHVVESNFSRSYMDHFSGRAASFRDCDFSNVSLEGAYFYRAFITGDPPKGMSLREANLQHTNFVQAYIAADLSGANLEGANLVYARLNQSLFVGSNLAGTEMYQVSLVKTDFSGAKFTNLKPPIFVDRCIGLNAAISKHLTEDSKIRMTEYMNGLQELISKTNEKST